MNDIANTQKAADLADKSLLIVDDDNPLRERLSRAMEKKGFKVIQAESVKQGINAAKKPVANKELWEILESLVSK